MLYQERQWRSVVKFECVGLFALEKSVRNLHFPVDSVQKVKKQLWQLSLVYQLVAN
jgi:hypothetical protein